MSKFAEADKFYLEAIAIRPSLRGAWLNRGLLAKEMLDWKQAKICLLEALRLRPEPSVSALILQLYLDTNDLETLNRESSIFQKNYPNLVEGYVYQSRGLAKQGDVTAARIVLMDGLSKVEQKQRIEHELGLYYFELGKLTESARYFRMALETAPYFIDAHRSLNELYFQTGDDKFLESYFDAEKKIPPSEILLHNLAAAQSSSGAIEDGIDTLKNAILKIGETAFLSHGLGALLVRKDELEQALPLFERALEIDPKNLRFILDRVSLAIKMGEENTCQGLIDRALAIQPYNQETWAYQGLIWRLQLDERYSWLYDYDVFLKSYDLPVPQGFDSISDFMQELNEYLETLHFSTKQPLDQSVVHGTQTMGVLLDDPHPLVMSFKFSLMECVDHYLATLPKDSTHPFLARVADGYAFSGSWSVQLKESGHHSNHVHPLGWLSCCSYVSVADLSSGKDGWIKFGETSLNLGENEMVSRDIQPIIGRCVFFPSYFWHGTYPVPSDQLRVTIPCDIDPVRFLRPT
jgi:tetratricopeptide (TPR) repeat protein